MNQPTTKEKQKQTVVRDTENMRRTRQQTKQMAMLAVLVGLSLMGKPAQASVKGLVQRGSTMFVQKNNKAFSESKWTIVTDIELEPAKMVIDRNIE